MPKTPGLIFEKLNNGNNGSYYTPDEIVNYMAEETITQGVITKFNEVYNKNFTTLEEWHNEIKNSNNNYNETFNLIEILDPVTGSGHFLVGALNRLVEIKKQLGLLNKPLFEEKRDILLHNLFAVDINYKAIMVCKMRLFVEMLDNDIKDIDNLPNLDKNILCGDSLTMFNDEKV